MHKNGVEQFLSVPNRAFNVDLFTDNELEMLKTVAQMFSDTDTKRIIELSHQEKAWVENQNNKNFIDYKYSFDFIHFPD